jgi:lipopolysaccharide export system protein LptA
MRPNVRGLAATLVFLASLSMTVLGPETARAVETDLPITIEADRATINEKEGVSTYSGHVVLTQGVIKVTADNVTVHQEKGQLTHITAKGNPVKYFQQGETAERDIHGQANTMEYFATEQRLKLIDNAKLSQGGNSFAGNQIDYDTQREVVTATVSKSGKQRVQVTIQPKTLKVPEPPPKGKTPPKPKK